VCAIANHKKTPQTSMKKADTDGRTAAISFSADGRYLGNIREDWRLNMNKSLALVLGEFVA
jgi:hypothetical protein